jgi:hypothetical protein
VRVENRSGVGVAVWHPDGLGCEGHHQRAMDEKQHAPPVPPAPPSLLVNKILEESQGHACPPRYAANQFAAWGWEQAIPEREELAGLLSELADKAKEHAGMVAAESYSDEPYSDEAEAIYRLASRAGAAAERLRGGDADD